MKKESESKREPLRPKAIRARSEVRLCSRFYFKKGQRVAFAEPYDQKSFELIRAKIFSGDVTKIAVLKVAIGKPEFDLVGRTVILSNHEMRRSSIRDGDANRSGSLWRPDTEGVTKTASTGRTFVHVLAE